MPNDTGWGGARKGAGRKPVADKRVSITAQYPSSVATEIKEYSKSHGITISDYLVGIYQEYQLVHGYREDESE